MRTKFLCISVLRVASGPRVKLTSCKSALTTPTYPAPNPPVVYSTGPGVSLTLCCFVVYSTRRFVFCLTLCYFVLVFFSPFSIAITSFGEERANLSTIRTFVRFALVWCCLFSLPLGVWEGLRLVIVALPGLFSYLFLFIKFYKWSGISLNNKRIHNVLTLNSATSKLVTILVVTFDWVHFLLTPTTFPVISALSCASLKAY